MFHLSMNISYMMGFALSGQKCFFTNFTFEIIYLSRWFHFKMQMIMYLQTKRESIWSHLLVLFIIQRNATFDTHFYATSHIRIFCPLRWWRSDYKKSSLASDGFMTSYSRSFWSLSFLKVTNGSRYKWLPRIKGRKWNALHLGRIYVPGRNRNRFSFKIDCHPQSCQFPADHFF